MPGISRALPPAAIAAALLVGDAFAAGRLGPHPHPAAWVPVAALGLVGLLCAIAAVLIARFSGRRIRVLERAGRELDELLQTSGSAEESERLLLSHAERILPGAGTGILLAAEGGERLTPVLADDVDQTPLRSIHTSGLGVRSCLAMRLGRGYERRQDDLSLTQCEVCGGVDADVACEPLVSGGEVIGTLLVGFAPGMTKAERVALRDSVRRAAPILAGQRELARAEERAVTDALTGLPNRRAAETTLKRMVAHAGRALSPMGVVMVDLDRFHVLNELHGETHGDKALAAVGKLLTATLRGSDYAARYGGEEFLLLLPDTDRQGSVEVAEKLRRTIERAELVQTGPITASMGVACLPEDAVDPAELLRKADRALYMAKVGGRNRVHAADHSSPLG